MKLQLSVIARFVQGELAGADLIIKGVGIDTRTLGAGELYIALKGKNFDGHSFIDKAEQAGAGTLRRCGSGDRAVRHSPDPCRIVSDTPADREELGLTDAVLADSR